MKKLILILFVTTGCSSTLKMHLVEPVKNESRFKKLFDEADRAFDREYKKSN